MNNIKIKSYLVFILYFISLFYFIPGLRNIGFLALIFLLILPIYLIIKEKRIIKDKIYIFFFITFIYYIIILFRCFSLRGIYNFILQLLILIDLICFLSINLDKKQIIFLAKLFKKSSYVLLIYNILLILFANKLGINYDGFKLSFRSMMYGSFFIGMYVKKQKLKTVVCTMFFYTMIMFLLRERTMALGTILFILIYWLQCKIHSKKVWNIIFLVFLLILFTIPIIYIKLYESPFAYDLNQLVGKYTHKNLFSGRQILWIAAFEKFLCSKWIGNGLGNYNFLDGGISMSVHNLYLFILLQGGIINLILIGVIIYLLFHKLLNCKYKNQYFLKLSISSLFTILLLADFGLILFANDIQFSIVLWTPIIFGLLQNNKTDNIKRIKR